MEYFTKFTRRIGGGYAATGPKPDAGDLVRVKPMPIPTEKVDSLPIASWKLPATADAGSKK